MKLFKNSIVFFWIGEKVEIPQVLVNSIRLVMGDEINVVQLTNNSTNSVEGVNEVKRFDLSNQIMIARLEAYSLYMPQTENTFFCDADSIFINKLKLPEINTKKIFLSPRKKDFNMNHSFPEYYEEFVGKKANQVMPFLFGAIAVKNNQQDFFKEILNICLSLPERFHRWYGDQYALKKYIDKGFDEFDRLDIDIYLNILKEPLVPSYLKDAYKKKVQLITFKGPQSKIYLEQSLILLNFFYKKLNL
tara:strand:- start:19 stop:759 length:741 start_codon:yes stop_codon:yes gene_type:complete